MLHVEAERNLELTVTGEDHGGAICLETERAVCPDGPPAPQSPVTAR
jgi:hypothetical protein